MRALRTMLAGGALTALVGGVFAAPPVQSAQPRVDVGLQKIKHVIIVMQENRSFDHYFGTFPGADGIPMRNGRPTVCAPDPRGGCVKPYHDSRDVNYGGPHSAWSSRRDIDHGRMDGFVREAVRAKDDCVDPDAPACAPDGAGRDVMGYHDKREIPNYWRYAKQFVLQDRMFEPVASWSEPVHLMMVSGWSARCESHDPMSCTSAIQNPDLPPDWQRRRGMDQTSDPVYAWTDITQLLYDQGVSWAYYVNRGLIPNCQSDSDLVCDRVIQTAHTPGIWNPLPYFDTVKDNGQTANVEDIQSFYLDAKLGTLPSVSWVVPNGPQSEHPPAKVSNGENYVTNLINTVAQGPAWDSTAIFLAWDDWGGFYDHVVPPKVDGLGYGMRVPGLLISPYAKRGYIDHQTLSFDAYLKFIEDVFLGGSRIDPRTDGRPDPRPTVRENVPILGNLASEFDFTQDPRPPVILPTDTRLALLPAGETNK